MYLIFNHIFPFSLTIKSVSSLDIGVHFPATLFLLLFGPDNIVRSLRGTLF